MLKKQTLLFLVFCFVSASSFAVTYPCEGKVKGVTIDPKYGHLFAENIGPLQWPRLCSVNEEYNGIQPDACKVVFSILLTAQTTQKSVKLWFSDGKDCSLGSHPEWEILTGWYSGPTIMD